MYTDARRGALKNGDAMNIGLREIQIFVVLHLVIEYVIHCILVRNVWRNCGRDVPLQDIMHPFSPKAEMNAIREDMEKRSKGMIGGDDELDRKKIKMARIFMFSLLESAVVVIGVAIWFYKTLVA